MNFFLSHRLLTGILDIARNFDKEKRFFRNEGNFRNSLRKQEGNVLLLDRQMTRDERITICKLVRSTDGENVRRVFRLVLVDKIVFPSRARFIRRKFGNERASFGLLEVFQVAKRMSSAFCSGTRVSIVARRIGQRVFSPRRNVPLRARQGVTNPFRRFVSSARLDGDDETVGVR